MEFYPLFNFENHKMFRTRYLVAFLLSTAVMMLSSLLWHGILLNDLRNIPQPEVLFFSLWALLYLGIGLGLTLAINLLSSNFKFSIKPWLVGALVGFFLYLIAFVLGISFKTNGAEHIVVDFLWQMIEQGIGGAVVGFVYYMAKRRDKIMNPES